MISPFCLLGRTGVNVDFYLEDDNLLLNNIDVDFERKLPGFSF